MGLKRYVVSAIFLSVLLGAWGLVSGFLSAKLIGIPVRIDGQYYDFDILVDFKNVKSYLDAEPYLDYKMNKHVNRFVSGFSDSGRESTGMSSWVSGGDPEEIFEVFSSTFGKVIDLSVEGVYKYGNIQSIFVQLENDRGQVIPAGFDFHLKNGEWKYSKPDHDDGVNYILLLSRGFTSSLKNTSHEEDYYWSNISRIIKKLSCNNWFGIFETGYPAEICIPVVLTNTEEEEHFRSIIGQTYVKNYKPIAYAVKDGNYMVIVSDGVTNNYYPVFLTNSEGRFFGIRSRQLELFLTPALLRGYIENIKK